jgi:non-heme chloroperoxidase
MGYYVKANHINIYVEDLRPECQKVILFLHGWPGNHHLFEYQFNRLPKYGYRCIGMDIRGFGKSDKPFSGYDYDTLADDVRGVVEALGLRDFTLVGHSTGGAIAARYMGRYQGYGVSKLVLVAAAAPSLIRRTNFPYGVEKETILQIIKDTYRDRPRMLRDFGDRFFLPTYIASIFRLVFPIGVGGGGMGHGCHCKNLDPGSVVYRFGSDPGAGFNHSRHS